LHFEFVVISARAVSDSRNESIFVSPIIDMHWAHGNYGEILDWLMTYCSREEVERTVEKLLSICEGKTLATDGLAIVRPFERQALTYIIRPVKLSEENNGVKS